MIWVWRLRSSGKWTMVCLAFAISEEPSEPPEPPDRAQYFDSKPPDQTDDQRCASLCGPFEIKVDFYSLFSLYDCRSEILWTDVILVKTTSGSYKDYAFRKGPFH